MNRFTMWKLLFFCSMLSVLRAQVGSYGDSLFSSGTFSTPEYPNNYHENAYNWQLRAAYNQRIFLATSYQHYMNTVFQRDHSVVGQGPNAECMRSLKPSSGHVDCSSDRMKIVIQRTYLNSLGYDNHIFFPNDPTCRPQVSTYQVVFSFPLNSCGNIRKLENGRIVYTNNICAFYSDDGQITRQPQLSINVSCFMEQDSMSQIMIVHNITDNSIIGSDRYSASMAFYTSGSFDNKVTEVPYEVALNQDLYVQVDLERDESGLILFMDTCMASSSPADFHSETYDLIRDGCCINSTYQPISSGTESLARFTFKAFQFLRATDTVYIQCKVLICPASDGNSRCRRGCHALAAREVSSEENSKILVVGPIKLKGPEEKEKGNEK